MTLEDKKQTAKELLLATAQRLFTEKGYAAVGTRELAEEAGVNLGAIQYHYGSKEALFIETVRSLMCSRNEANQLLIESAKVESVEQAAVELSRFFHSFVQDVCKPCGPNVCKLMYREVLDTTSQESEMFKTLVALVVEEFIQPVDDHLRGLVRRIAPQLSEQEVSLAIHSIIGQCSFYVTHRPFIEKLRGFNLDEQDTYSEIAKHIARFTLAALGLEKEDIERAVFAADSGKGK